jgi:hypothetical protein
MAAAAAWNTKCQKGRKWANISWKKYHCSPMLGVRSATCTKPPVPSSGSSVGWSCQFGTGPADTGNGCDCCSSKLNLRFMLQPMQFDTCEACLCSHTTCQGRCHSYRVQFRRWSDLWLHVTGPATASQVCLPADMLGGVTIGVQTRWQIAPQGAPAHRQHEAVRLRRPVLLPCRLLESCRQAIALCSACGPRQPPAQATTITPLSSSTAGASAAGCLWLLTAGAWQAAAASKHLPTAVPGAGYWRGKAAHGLGCKRGSARVCGQQAVSTCRFCGEQASCLLM